MPDSPPSTKLPFWIHQALEYLCGLLVVSQAIHASSVTLPVVAGATLILLGATADGPLAAFRLVARGLHRVLDIVAIVLLAGALALFVVTVTGPRSASWSWRSWCSSRSCSARTTRPSR